MALNRYFLDANILIRHLTQDNAVLSKKATTFIEKVAKKEVLAYITTLVLHETIYICRYNYKVNRKDLVTSLTKLLTLTNLLVLDMDKTAIYGALEDFATHNVDFPDCIYKHLTIENQLELISFDKDFKKLNLPTKLL